MATLAVTRVKRMGAIGTTLGDRYRLDEELGRGGMGVVYRAHDTVLGRDVAVKLLSDANLGEDGRARLLREATIVAQLDHPNIVTLFDVGEYQGSPFMVMQLRTLVRRSCRRAPETKPCRRIWIA